MCATVRASTRIDVNKLFDVRVWAYARSRVCACSVFTCTSVHERTHARISVLSSCLSRIQLPLHYWSPPSALQDAPTHPPTNAQTQTCRENKLLDVGRDDALRLKWFR